MSYKIEDSLPHRQRFNRRKRTSSSSSPNPHDDDHVNYYSAHLIGNRCYGSEDFESFHPRKESGKITEFERSYFGSPNTGKIQRGRSQSPSFLNRHSTFSSDSDSCSSINNMMADCIGPEITSSDSDDPEEVIYPEEQLNHVREFMARRSLRMMTEEKMSRYPPEGRGCVCSNSMDSGYKSFGTSPDVGDHSFDVRSERGKRQPSRYLHPDYSSKFPSSRCPITTNQRFMARYKNNSLDNRLNSSHLANMESRNVPLGLYEAKIANRIRNQQMSAHLDHLLHLRKTLMTAIQRVESTSPRSSRGGSPNITSRSTSPAVTVIARTMKTITPNASPLVACNSPARSSSDVGVRPRRLLPIPGQRLHSNPKLFHSPQLNDIRRVIQTSKMFEEEKSGSSETSSVTSSSESTANSNSISVYSSDVTFQEKFPDRNSSLINTAKIGNLIGGQSLAVPWSETSGYSTGREEVEQVSDDQEDRADSLLNKPGSTDSRCRNIFSHESGISVLEHNFKSLLSDEDDTRLVVDLENFNPSEVPEALKMRPGQERKHRDLGDKEENLRMVRSDLKNDKTGGMLKSPRGTHSPTVMDDQENECIEVKCSRTRTEVSNRLKRVPERDKKKGSVSPMISEATIETERKRHPSSHRESVLKLEALSTTNALMFKCAAAASFNKQSATSSPMASNHKARTIVSSTSDSTSDSTNEADHRKLSPPHINAILDKHLRRKKSRSACSTPKKLSSEPLDGFSSHQVG